MRLVNRSYTQVKVEVSEGLGGGSRQNLRRNTSGILTKFPIVTARRRTIVAGTRTRILVMDHLPSQVLPAKGRFITASSTSGRVANGSNELVEVGA